MFKLLKYLPMLAIGKDARKAYEEENGKDRPAYLSRRFVGAILAAAGLFLSVHYGVQVSKEDLALIGDNIEKIVAAGIAIQGVVVTIVGYFGRQK